MATKTREECFALPPTRSFRGEWPTILIHERNFKRTISEDEEYVRSLVV